MFPNAFDVYLHDTPSRELFRRPDRSFSSGCIRLQRPVDLAAHLLGPSWPPERIRAAIDARAEQTVRLAAPIDVHLIHLTSWVSRDGTVHFRHDVYGRDPLLDGALRQAPPGPMETVVSP